jgi:MFS family permease
MTHRRWTIGVLLAAGVLVNYIDRISLSVAAPQLQHDFGLSPQAVGFLFSAFFWSYALFQLPGGLLLDRFGIKTVGRWGTFLWSAASAATALCSGYAGIFTARLLLGIAEAPGMIGNQKATGLWFPTRERCRSTAIFDSAAKFANVIGVPIVAFFVVGFGWRWGFAVTAMLSFLYFVAYWLMYRDPSEDKHLSRQEHAYILAGGAVPEGQPAAGQANMLAYVLRNRKVWAHMIGYSAYGYSFYLFLTWLPGYLVESLHMSILKSAGFATIPWIFASFADLLIGGFFVDYLIGRGLDETKVRKVAIACGMSFLFLRRIGGVPSDNVGSSGLSKSQSRKRRNRRMPSASGSASSTRRARPWSIAKCSRPLPNITRWPRDAITCSRRKALFQASGLAGSQ